MQDCKINPKEIKIGQLLANVGRLHATRADQALERIGLYRGQGILLMILSHDDGLTHSEIAEKLEISLPSATKVIKRMEALEYVQRRPDPVDERVSRVFLQEKGWAVIQQIRKVFAQIDQVLFNNLTPEERATLMHLLMKVYSSLLDLPPDELEKPAAEGQPLAASK